MKRKLSSAFVAIAIVFSAASVSAASNELYTFGVSRVAEEPYKTDTDPNRHRVPPHITMCSITRQGVAIPGVSTENISGYEVFNQEGTCLGSFTTEQDFLSFLFTLSGNVEVRFHIGESVYHGYLCL